MSMIAAVFTPHTMPALALVLGCLVAGMLAAVAVAANASPAARIKADVANMIRARITLLHVQSADEHRAEQGLFEAAASAGMVPYVWDCSLGLMDARGNVVAPDEKLGIPDGASLSTAKAMVQYIRARLSKLPEHRAFYVLRDFDDWLREPVMVRALRTLAREMARAKIPRAQAVAILSPQGLDVPKLAADATVVRWPRPDEGELAGIWDAILGRQPEDVQTRAKRNGTRERSVKSMLGLEAAGASKCLSRSLVETGDSDPIRIAAAKRAAVEAEAACRWIDPDPRGADAIGGNARLKAWIEARKCLLTDKARAFGLDPMKGIMLAGLPGTGKSLAARCLGTILQVPVIMLKLMRTKSKYVSVGSENWDRIQAMLDSLGPCVVWIDEVDKQLSAASGESDGGSSMELLANVLTWMQERTSQAVVFMTANDTRYLPDELTRKGRLDELFWLGLPNATDRAEILAVSLRAKGRDPAAFDLAAVAAATRGFVGAELAALVQPALLRAYNDAARNVETADLLDAASRVIPKSRKESDRIVALKAWGEANAIPANDPEQDAVNDETSTPDLMFA